VRLLLEDVAKSLADNICFSFGRESEFNNLKTKESRYIWLLPLIANFPINDTTRTKTWIVSLLFMEVDRFDASNKETGVIHDELDVLVDKFIRRLDDWSQTQNDTVGAITLSTVRQDAFFKEQAGIVSGWKVDFTMQVPDGFNYCVEDNIRIYAGNY
jgi:hypothetical protein